MDIVNIASAIKKLTIKELRDFIFENYYKRIGFSEKKKQLLFNEASEKKIIEKIPDPSNAKEY